MGYLHRILRIIFGLFLFAVGEYLCITANIGLSPWSAFSMGVSYLTGLSFGNIVVLTGIFILFIDFLLKEKIGVGTILNTLLIGKFVDFFSSFNIIPPADNVYLGIAELILGLIMICIGSYFYISEGMGCGPRDSLMLALSRKFSRLPVGLIRGLLEGSVLLIGYGLGAKVGIGTIISVFGIGFILEFTFKAFKFDVKAVSHEGIDYTINYFRRKK